MDSITLVGRASNVGTAEQEFTITVGPVSIRCECRSPESREAFAAISEGALISLVVTIAKVTSGERSLVLDDRLERLPG
jgi:hypothetical protein